MIVRSLIFSKSNHAFWKKKIKENILGIKCIYVSAINIAVTSNLSANGSITLPSNDACPSKFLAIYPSSCKKNIVNSTAESRLRDSLKNDATANRKQNFSTNLRKTFIYDYFWLQNGPNVQAKLYKRHDYELTKSVTPASANMIKAAK